MATCIAAPENIRRRKKFPYLVKSKSKLFMENVNVEQGSQHHQSAQRRTVISFVFKATRCVYLIRFLWFFISTLEWERECGEASVKLRLEKEERRKMALETKTNESMWMWLCNAILFILVPLYFLLFFFWSGGVVFLDFTLIAFYSAVARKFF